MPHDAPQLSLFEGEEVIANALHVSGKVTDPALQPLDEYRHRQTVVLLVVAHVDYVGFDDGKVGLIRDQKIKVDEAYDPADLVDVAALLEQLREQNAEALHERMRKAELKPVEMVGWA